MVDSGIEILEDFFRKQAESFRPVVNIQNLIFELHLIYTFTQLFCFWISNRKSRFIIRNIDVMISSVHTEKTNCCTDQI